MAMKYDPCFISSNSRAPIMPSLLAVCGTETKTTSASGSTESSMSGGTMRWTLSGIGGQQRGGNQCQECLRPADCRSRVRIPASVDPQVECEYSAPASRRMAHQPGRDV